MAYRAQTRTLGHLAVASDPGRALYPRWLRLVGGLAVFAAGLALMVRAGLGLSSWDVFHDAIRVISPLSFGQTIVAVSLVVLVAAWALGVAPGPGTVANSVLVGVFTDAILWSPILRSLGSGPLPFRLLAVGAGVVGVALGSALYIGADLGAGPRDGLMLGLAKRSRSSVGSARTMIEVSVVVAGVALGGSIGVGTAVFIVLIGPAIDVSFRLFGMESPRDKSRPRFRARVARLLRAWGRPGRLGTSSSIETSRYTGARI